MAWDPIDSAQLNPGFPVLPHMRKAWNSLLWLYGQIGTLSANGVQNGSFEIDSSLDGLPDNWTFAAYPGGSGAISASVPAHGAYAMGMTHPGGTGNGGGTLESDYNLCSELLTQYLGFIHWATASGMHNQVQIRYFDKAKAYISAETVYDSVSNPTAATYFIAGFTPPATARFFKVKLIGGNSDTDVAGTAYFDGLQPAGFELLDAHITAGACAETNNYAGTSWYDGTSMTISPWLCNLPIAVTFTGYGKSAYGTNGLRFRIGTNYSNEVTTLTASYAAYPFTINVPAAEAHGSLVVTMQLKQAHGYSEESTVSVSKQ